MNKSGGSPLLKDLTVPAGLFLFQQAFSSKTPMTKDIHSVSTVPDSLYDRLLGLVGVGESKAKTRRHLKKHTKQKTRKNKNN